MSSEGFLVHAPPKQVTSSEVVTLAYKRMANELSTGFVTIEKPESGGVLARFDSASWKDVVVAFHKALVAHPEADAVIQRIDREGIQPVRVSQDLLHLLRTDVVRAIKALEFPNTTIVIGDKKRPLRAVGTKETTNIMKPIPAGYDTLVATFGDFVLVKSAKDKAGCQLVESPMDGFWRSVDLEPYLVAWYSTDKKWAAIATKDLLELDCPRFFLGRPWNPKPPWIDKTQLQQMFNNYKEEKEKTECYLSDDKSA